MAESSIFWTTGSTGDGTTTYTQTQLFDWLRRTFVGRSPTTEGVLAGYANELAVSGTSTPVSVATGAAFVYGVPYENSTSTTVAIPTPSAGTSRYDRIVLRASWSAQTVRITRIAGTESASPTIPALTQTVGTTWDIPLATVLVNAAGAISVTDARAYCHYNTKVSQPMLDTGIIDDTHIANRVVKLTRRQGYTSASWGEHLGGSLTNYTPTVVLEQVGLVRWTGSAASSGNVSVSFPVSFNGGSPIVDVSVTNTTTPKYTVSTVVSSAGDSVSIYWRTTDGSTITSLDIMWRAVGPG